MSVISDTTIRYASAGIFSITITALLLVLYYWALLILFSIEIMMKHALSIQLARDTGDHSREWCFSFLHLGSSGFWHCSALGRQCSRILVLALVANVPLAHCSR